MSQRNDRSVGSWFYWSECTETASGLRQADKDRLKPERASHSKSIGTFRGLGDSRFFAEAFFGEKPRKLGHEFRAHVECVQNLVNPLQHCRDRFRRIGNVLGFNQTEDFSYICQTNKDSFSFGWIFFSKEFTAYVMTSVLSMFSNRSTRPIISPTC